MASFSLKPDVPAWSRTLPAWACAVLGAAALAAFLPGLGELPGLHGDEAAAGLRADALVHGGPWSWFGGGPHRGPLHQLLVAVSFAALGPSVWSLRLVGALTNAVAVAFYAWTTGQLFGRRTAVLASLALVTAPCFWLSARTATEHTALSALLATAATACLLVGRRPPGLGAEARDGATGRPCALAAGALLGLGSWNHAIFLAVPATLLAWALGQWGAAALRRPEVLWTAFGWACVEAGPLTQLGGELGPQGGSGAVLARLQALPRALGAVWQGDVVALRVVGRISAAQPPWAQGLLALAALGLLAAAFDVGLRAGRARMVLTATLGLGACTAALVPAPAERHLLLPLLALPVVAAEGLVALARPLGPRGRTLATSVCALAIGLQSAQAVANVVQPLRRGELAVAGGPPGALAGAHDRVSDTHALYTTLVELGITHVQAHRYIGAPLRFYDLPTQRLRVDELPVPVEQAAQTLAQPDGARAQVPLLTFTDEWPALQVPLQRAEAARGLQRPLACVASLGAFTLVRRVETELD